MARFVFAFVLSLVSASALSAETIDLGPSDWRKWDPRTSHHSLEGLRTSYGQPVRMGPGGGSLNVTRNPVIPYGSIGNGLKGLARSTPGAIAASAVMSGLFYGMDWLFEEGAWVKLECPDDNQCKPLDGQYHPAAMCSNVPYAVNTVGGIKIFTSDRSFNNWPAGSLLSATVVHGTGPGVFANNCVDRFPSGRWPSVEGRYPRLYISPIDIADLPAPVPIPLTDADYSELTAKLPTAPPGVVGDAADEVMRRQGAPLPGFTDTPVTGPSSVTGPSTSTSSTGPEGNITSTSTTTTNISYGPTTITTTNTTTTNTYTNGELSGTTTTTETPSPDLVTEPTPSPGSTSLDIPTDCEFMPTVCAFLDWFKEPVPMPEPDLPVVVDHDFEREYEMNLTAECPPPYTVDTQLFGTLSISWAPFCDLAGLMKPLVVGSAFLMSAFITLGIGRGRA